MATNKTIQPTNVTVQIPAMTDTPDASVFSNAIDKSIDGINTLNSHMTTLSSPDLNNLKESGLYYVGGASNSPGGSTNWWGHVVVIANSTGTEVKQIFYNNSSDEEYTRYYRNNAWSAWNNQINDDLTNTVTIGQNATIERLVVHRIGKLVFFSFRATNTTNLDILIDNLPAAKKTTGICPYSGSQLAYIAEGSRSIQAQGILTNQNITGFYIST